MSLLKRVERAQRGPGDPSDSALVPVAPAAPAPPRGPGRGEQIGDIRLQLQREEIDLEVGKFERDRANVARMVAADDDQIADVARYKGKVSEQRSAQDAVVKLIASINQKIAANILDIDQAQKAFIQTVIDGENTTAL